MNEQTLYIINYIIKKTIAKKIGAYPLTNYIILGKINITSTGDGKAVVTGKYLYRDEEGKYRIILDLDRISPIECEILTG